MSRNEGTLQHINVDCLVLDFARNKGKSKVDKENFAKVPGICNLVWGQLLARRASIGQKLHL